MGEGRGFRILLNGRVYTADKADGVAEAMAVKDGFVLAVGPKEELLSRFGGAAARVDLGGATVVPGLVDCHLHPLWGGLGLGRRSLGYRDLSSAEILATLGGFLEEEGDAPPDSWLVVASWDRRLGDDPTRGLLDSLPTPRPIVLFSDDCHFAALNSQALGRLLIPSSAPWPSDGWICLGPDGAPNGILEDGPAMRALDQVTRLMGRSEHHGILRDALGALAAQGVTSLLDARCGPETLGLLGALEAAGELPLRYSAALELRDDGLGSGAPMPRGRARKALGPCERLRENLDGGQWGPAPGISVGHLKFFVDGVPATHTAFLSGPYNVDRGAPGAPDWRPGAWRGRPYFGPGVLKELVAAGAERGFAPHFHAIGDAAVAEALDAAAASRRLLSQGGPPPSLAHCELVTPDLLGAFGDLGALAVLSFQWAGRTAGELGHLRGLYGPARFAWLECHGRFLDAGVGVAYGSDWPVDPLDIWGNLHVGLTRALPAGAGGPRPRMDNDRGLTAVEALRAATITAAKVIGRDALVGSLEPGKLADYVVVEGDILNRPEGLRGARVLATVVGGKEVYRAGGPSERPSPCA